MGLFASFALYRCPRCGASIPSVDIKYDGEPELRVLDCEHCKAKLQARHDRTSGKMVIEKRVEQ